METLGKYFPNTPMLAAVVKVTKAVDEETFLKEYLQTLNASYKRSQANDVAEALLAGKEKDFAKADAIRDELLAKGVAIKDTREGVKWELV